MDNFNESWIIYETISGSQLYGTNLPDSDTDKKGVCIPPLNVRDNPFIGFEQQEFPGDRSIYNLKKFMQLASDCNPNIIELMFPSTTSIISITEKGEKLLSKVNLFLSTKAKFTFTGYAISQLKRIKLHREWLLNPPKKKPERADFGLNEVPEFGLEKINNLIYAPEECIKDEYKLYAKREIAYRSAKEYWDNYSSWQKTRNPKRAELEAKYGYDTKHGSHLYRLLTEGLELLETGFITMPRPDKEFLLKIRKGEFSYEELLELVGNFQEKIDNAKSILPEKPNYKKITELYFELVKE